MNIKLKRAFEEAIIELIDKDRKDHVEEVDTRLKELESFKSELEMKSIEDVQCFSSDASTLQDLRNLDLEEIEANLDVLVNSTLLEDLAPLRDFNADSVLSDIETHNERLEELEEKLEEVDLEEMQEKLENLDLEEIEKRLVICVDQDTRQKEALEALTQENEELKERLLSIENFLLKTFKGFGND